MNLSTILDSADRLRSNSPVIKLVEENAEALLLRINSDIMDAYNQQKDNIIFRLPYNFDLGHTQISNEEVQIQVYYKIIDELEKKNYKIRMKIEDGYSAYIYISWKQIIDNKDISYMRKKINNVQIR